MIFLELQNKAVKLSVYNFAVNSTLLKLELLFLLKKLISTIIQAQKETPGQYQKKAIMPTKLYV